MLVFLREFLDLLVLLFQVLGHFIVDVRHHFPEGQLVLPLRGVQHLHHLLPGLAPHLRLLLVRPPPFVLEPDLEPSDWITRLPGLHFGNFPVPGRVVRGGVVAAAVGHRLDEHGALVLHDVLARRLRRVVHRDGVHPIHPESRHTIGRPPAGNAVSSVLLVRGRGDRPPVVPAEEEDRAGQRRREVHRRVEVALARGPFSKVRHRDPVVAIQLVGVGRPGSLGQLRGQRGGNGVHVQVLAPVVDRHLPPFPKVPVVAVALVRKLLESLAAPQQQTVLPVLGKDVVGRLEGRRGADHRRLLPEASHVKAEATLPLGLVEQRVQRLKPHHRSVHVLGKVLLELELFAPADELPPVVEHPEARQRGHFGRVANVEVLDVRDFLVPKLVELVFSPSPARRFLRSRLAPAAGGGGGHRAPRRPAAAAGEGEAAAEQAPLAQGAPQKSVQREHPPRLALAPLLAKEEIKSPPLSVPVRVGRPRLLPRPRGLVLFPAG
mmetsp:Transcript_5360/g.13817  ORF Transcript_5360/g.13817 Transcript_5360/m.13817 type:complete len:491 (+) Transcript_5360:1258-2730(+)